ncbi:MAG TPA: hypothetical protein VKA70_12600 [Blastocatellia bacterium]|nr:hypothetical protein [Blastocatellia bacterium]
MRDVQVSDRLVQYKQPRTRGERPRQHHALALAAGKLVHVSRGELRRFGHLHGSRRFAHVFIALKP